MKRRSYILMLLIVAVPLGLLSGAALQLTQQEHIVIQQQFHGLMQQRLTDTNRTIERYFEETETRLDQLTSLDQPQVEELRQLNRTHPLVMQMFLLSPDGRLQYPNPAQPLNGHERSFLLKTSSLFSQQHLSVIRRPSRTAADGSGRRTASQGPSADHTGLTVGGLHITSNAVTIGPANHFDSRVTSRDALSDDLPDPAEIPSEGPVMAGQVIDLNRLALSAENVVSPETSAVVANNVPDDSSLSADRDAEVSAVPEGSRLTPESLPADRGWFPWYFDRGLNLIYWNRRPSGQVVGVAIDRTAWMSGLVGHLPDSSVSSDAPQLASRSRIQLLSASGESVYQWGDAGADNTEVTAEIAVAAPLSSWRLRCLANPEALPQATTLSRLGWFGGLLAVVLATATLAWVLVRDFRRDLLHAEQQVSFVNQVSHELKTPLTNIRMYAELLDSDLQQVPKDLESPLRRRLDVILSEGQRLSRLIGNVLTFARQKRRTLQPGFRDCVPDDVIRQVLNHFAPALTSQGIRTTSELQAGVPVKLDSDFLEQILGNLISNVEKYAASGEQLIVRSRLQDGLLEVDVIDDGPGVPARQTDRIFLPFERLSQEVSAAAGTGIGLAISRQLAELHGGTVRLQETAQGCHFQVRLKLG